MRSTDKLDLIYTQQNLDNFLVVQELYTLVCYIEIKQGNFKLLEDLILYNQQISIDFLLKEILDLLKKDYFHKVFYVKIDGSAKQFEDFIKILKGYIKWYQTGKPLNDNDNPVDDNDLNF
jgi:hypothetical protein